MKKKLLLLLLWTISIHTLWAQQKNTQNIEQIWLGYFNQSRLLISGELG
ncbi:MAG: hypothetical protein ABI594_02845 [Ginsengibacter sp.]